MVNKVYSNRLSEYAHENGGRVLLLFLLFLVELYSFKNSGINGIAMMLAIPVSILAVYFAFSYRMLTFWALFLINFFVMFLQKENKMPLPASLPNEMLELALIAIAIIDLRDTKFENLANLMLIGVLGWCIFCIIEVFNDTCGLGMNFTAWFTGARLMAFQLLYAVIVFSLYINTPQKVYQLIFWWAGLLLFAVFWTWKQQNIGFTDAENAWLNNYAYRTHRVNGILRYWSVFNDAAIFGIHMAAAGVFFVILAITNKIKKYRILFLIVGILSIWAMFASGTRTAIFCLIAGFCVFLVLSKSVKIIAPVSLILTIFLSILIFTDIGQGNSQIRRMRSAFNKEDASANVRDVNKAAIAKYMKEAPWGIGIGIFADNIPAWNKYKIVSQIPPDSEYVFIWVRTGVIGVVIFAFCMILMFIGGSSVVLFKLKSPSLIGIGGGLCSAFVAIQLGGYGNQVIYQYPNGLTFFGGMAIVYLLPYIEKEWIEYEQQRLEEQEKKKQLKLQKKLAKRV